MSSLAPSNRLSALSPMRSDWSGASTNTTGRGLMCPVSLEWGMKCQCPIGAMRLAKFSDQLQLGALTYLQGTVSCTSCWDSLQGTL